MEVLNVRRILGCFKLIPGLKINFHKSMVCGIGVDNDLTKSLADLLKCRMQSLPLTYLGMPLGASKRFRATWKPIIDKFKRKSASKKWKYLLFGVRLTLIESVLRNLPIYYLSLYRTPNGVIKEIEKIQSNFLRGGSEANKRIHLVSWKKICRGKAKGIGNQKL